MRASDICVGRAVRSEAMGNMFEKQRPDDVTAEDEIAGVGLQAEPMDRLLKKHGSSANPTLSHFATNTDATRVFVAYGSRFGGIYALGTDAADVVHVPMHRFRYSSSGYGLGACFVLRDERETLLVNGGTSCGILEVCAQTGAFIRLFSVDTPYYTESMACSHSGDVIAFGGTGTIILVAYSTGAVTRRFKAISDGSFLIKGVAFTRDDAHVFVIVAEVSEMNVDYVWKLSASDGRLVSVINLPAPYHARGVLVLDDNVIAVPCRRKEPGKWKLDVDGVSVVHASSGAVVDVDLGHGTCRVKCTMSFHPLGLAQIGDGAVRAHAGHAYRDIPSEWCESRRFVWISLGVLLE